MGFLKTLIHVRHLTSRRNWTPRIDKTSRQNFLDPRMFYSFKLKNEVEFNTDAFMNEMTTCLRKNNDYANLVLQMRKIYKNTSVLKYTGFLYKYCTFPAVIYFDL